MVLALVLTLALFAPAMAQDKAHNLAHAIAMAEGYYSKGTIPNRLHNPGDITSSSRHTYPGQIGLYHGYVVFKNDTYGWAALLDQIQRVIDGTSTRYTQSMTFAQIARKYAEDRNWGKKVCSILGITPNTTFEVYFDLPPKVKYEFNPRLLQALPRS
jgi:hypothetical protein